MVKLHDCMVISFDALPVCDKLIDGQTERLHITMSHYSTAEHDENY